MLYEHPLMFIFALHLYFYCVTCFITVCPPPRLLFAYLFVYIAVVTLIYLIYYQRIFIVLSCEERTPCVYLQILQLFGNNSRVVGGKLSPCGLSI